MKPTDKWLIDVKAIASAEGWRHPKTNELLKAMPLDVVEQVEPIVTVDEVEPIVTVDEPDVQVTVETKPETNEDESGKVKTSKNKTRKQK